MSTRIRWWGARASTATPDLGANGRHAQVKLGTQGDCRVALLACDDALELGRDGDLLVHLPASKPAPPCSPFSTTRPPPPPPPPAPASACNRTRWK